MLKFELARDDSDLLHFCLLSSLKISRTASKMLSQVVILEGLDGRCILCQLAIVDILGASIFSRYLHDLDTVIIPPRKVHSETRP